MPGLLLLQALLGVGAAWSQPIIYVGQNATTHLGELRVINSDSSGDRALPVGVVEAGFPSMSKDGRFVALTAQTPGRPNQSSRNVFVLDLRTATLSPVTQFEDAVSGDGHSFTLPWYHSLSADLSTLAVWGFVESGSISNESTTPVLQTYRVSDGFLLDTKFINRQLTGYTQGGDGVDWHPTQNLLVFAVDRDIPVFDYNTGVPLGTVAEGTALSLLPGNQAGIGQQLTFPRSFALNSLSRVFITGEADYAPAFSPNGQQVAYVRATYIEDSLAPSYRQPSILTLRVVNLDGSGDRAVLNLNQGIYVTHLSWSRDGTQLVFDAGNQLVVSGIPANLVDPQTVALWLVNTNGTNLRSLRGPVSGFPVWTPAGTSFCSVPGMTVGGGPAGSIDDCGAPLQLRASRNASGQFHLDITGGAPNVLYRVQASPDLVNPSWQTLGTVPWAGGTTPFTDTTGVFPSRFYRVMVGGP